MLMVVIISAVLLIALTLLFYRKLPSSMPIVGGHSGAISAACHISPLSTALPDPDATDKGESTDVEQTTVGNEGFLEHYGQVLRSSMSQSLLRWGIVRMPEKWYHSFQYVDDRVKVAHLSFGGIVEDVQTPQENELYFFR